MSMDPLLYAVRDFLRGAGWGYDEATCEVRDSGTPPPRCGVWFAAVHQGAVRSTALNCLDEYYDFFVTLTKRVDLSDRVGQRDLSRDDVQKLLVKTGLNNKARQIALGLHMEYGVLQDANDYLVAWNPDVADLIYGFGEPARYSGTTVEPVYADWFGAEASEGNPMMGLKAEISFVDCRRLQALGEFT